MDCSPPPSPPPNGQKKKEKKKKEKERKGKGGERKTLTGLQRLGRGWQWILEVVEEEGASVS